MTVIIGLMVTVLNCYPRHRRIVVPLLCLLALGLVATNHHYLGDVIAGACLGAGVAFCLGGKRFSKSAADERV